MKSGQLGPLFQAECLPDEPDISASFADPSLDEYFCVNQEQSEAALQQQCDLFAKWRDQILAKETFYTAKDLAKLYTNGLGNSTEDVLHLRVSGKVFGVFFNGKYRYPKFQFSTRDMHPLAAMEEVIGQVPKKSRQWPLLLWFWSDAGLLGGKKPRDLMSEHMSESERQDLVSTVEAFFSPLQP